VKRDFASPDGTFRWPDPPPGKQRVFVHAPGFALLALGEFDLGEFDLTTELPVLRAELVPGVRVHGSVLDEEGNPIPDALVFSEEEAPTDGLFFSDALLNQTFWLPTAARTGPDGRFELAHLNPGRHTLRAGAPGFAPAWELGVGAPRADELVFTLGRGGTVEGLVERDDGGPWAGAELVVVAMDQGERARVSFGFTRTGDDGRYRFEHLPPLTLIVVSMRVEGRPEVRPVQVVAGQTVTADFEPPRRGIRLHGRVLGRNGAPLARKNLGLFDRETASWNQDWVATTTDAAGAYEFEGVQAGRYQLFLIDEMGRELRCVDALVVPSGSVEVEHDVRVAGGRLLASVREAQSGDPVPLTALTVSRIEEDGGESFSSVGLSDANGRFEFTDLRPGTYVVYAYPTREGLGFARGERVSVAEGVPAEIEVLLEEGGSLSVVVRDPDGRALEGAAVLFHDESGVEHTFSRLPLTDAAGRYRASGLRPGRYRVVAHLVGHQGTPVEFRFELGRELEIPILLAPLSPR
jgi:protocatechuate 3,4-dioxygenase beta subunit